jgi:hypothetical protein
LLLCIILTLSHHHSSRNWPSKQDSTFTSARLDKMVHLVEARIGSSRGLTHWNVQVVSQAPWPSDCVVMWVFRYLAGSGSSQLSRVGSPASISNTMAFHTSTMCSPRVHAIYKPKIAILCQVFAPFIIQAVSMFTVGRCQQHVFLGPLESTKAAAIIRVKSLDETQSFFFGSLAGILTETSSTFCSVTGAEKRI